MRVDEKSNEITDVPILLSQLDLREVVVSGDAMFNQRELSIQLSRPKETMCGRSRTTKKDYEKISRGSSSPIASALAPLRPNDFRIAQTIEKGHGRLDKQIIRVSSMLAEYSTLPHLAQVF